MITIEDIFKSFRLPLTEARKKLIINAYEFSDDAHKGQKRKSGEDYIQHSLATAKTLADIGMGSKTIAAGLLHDVPEDTSVTLDEVEKKFGMEIASLVNGITKLGKIKLRESKEEYFLENLRKMFLAMAADIRVVIVKLADRLHNMRTLEHLPPEKQKRIAQETMEIYAPIANRLGIGEIKGQLEDLSFKYIEPEDYEYVKNLEIKHYKEREKYVNLSIEELKEGLENEGIKVIDIYGRAKHLYRLFKKLQRHNMDINQIYDLVAIRIIVPDIADCYEALGIVHKKFRPMVGRIKDYISLPKPNGYQSIHTTIFGPEGRILEVQIRTQKMHDEAEFGIAAHWVYSEKEKGKWKKYFSKTTLKKKVPEKELAWVKQLREWQNEIGRDDEEFLEGLRIDFFKNHIFAFTPKGDIIDFPEEATPVDFAYAIHSEVGNRTMGAKADGNIVPLNYNIKNGQVIEILTSKENKKPSRDWLRFVKTSLAKSHIKKAIKESGLA
ncbi:MAG TPA: bifunctional (p)ppGpp synthetase/guanosine-3',5'-bis(diphosphate) 3'-pyrophosphohydrolase [Candidatus Moranbacteria bacterium]|nr:bifunctional (p)ppGpp synthetase/guanosine-3',5'-bis(diphosphate) 3'-pyrophosphohydrolase [Candidatus Moranbacteria bacterium]